MWYDRMGGQPPGGSLLETIFVLVRLERQQAQMLETRALLQAIVGLHESRETQDPAIKAFKEYQDRMFPFLEGAKDPEKQTQRERLMELVKKAVKIDLLPHYKNEAAHARQMAARRHKRLRPRMPGVG